MNKTLFALSFSALTAFAAMPAKANDFGNIASGIGAVSGVIGNFQNEKTNRHLSEMQRQQAADRAASARAARNRAAASAKQAEAARVKAEADEAKAKELAENEQYEGQLFSCESRMKRLKKEYVSLAPDSVDTFNDYTLQVSTLTSPKAKAVTCQRFIAEAEADLDTAAARYRRNQSAENAKLDYNLQHKKLDYNHIENLEELSITRLRAMNDSDLQTLITKNDLVKTRINALVAESFSSDQKDMVLKSTEIQAKIANDNNVLSAVKAAIAAQPKDSDVQFNELLKDKKVKTAIFQSAEGAIAFERK